MFLTGTRGLINNYTCMVKQYHSDITEREFTQNADIRQLTSEGYR